MEKIVGTMVLQLEAINIITDKAPIIFYFLSIIKIINTRFADVSQLDSKVASFLDKTTRVPAPLERGSAN